jgi:hypothetical protein
MKWAATFVCWLALLAQGQEFSQRGFIEVNGNFYPQTFPIDSTRAIGGMVLRYEPKWHPKPWFTLEASFDGRMNSHQQVARDLHFDWNNRSLQRARLSIRELAAVFRKGNFTFTLGKQFIRWGEADFINPTDRFAPTDLLNLVDQEILPVTAARATYDRGNETFNFVWQPEFTPARVPLVDQRWTFLPPAYYSFDAQDQGPTFPGRYAFGVRWNHSSARYDYSLIYYDGFNCFPDFNAQVNAPKARLTYSRMYPALRLYGGDLTVPASLFTFKSEAAYYTSSTKNHDEYVLYLLELERQIHEAHIIVGYAGEVVTAHGDALQYLGERGFARGLISHVLYTLDANRSFTLDAFVRQNGASSLIRPAFSQSFREHWRATVGFAWLRGEASDFLGQYHRNSFASAELRYSF